MTRKTKTNGKTTPASKSRSRAPIKNPVARSKAGADAAQKSDQVDTYMAKLDHPFKAEAEAVRKIIKGVSRDITEEIKWAAPTFSYKGYIVTFHLRATQHLHLVFHNAAILNDTSGLLLGDYIDRRMMYFADMKDVRAKKGALVKIIRAWIEMMDSRE